MLTMGKYFDSLTHDESQKVATLDQLVLKIRSAPRAEFWY